MASQAKIDYDDEYDILYAYTGTRVRDSFEVNDFVIDFSMDNKVVGIEIMDASKTISGLVGKKIGAAVLSKIDRASISVIPGKDMAYIFLTVSAPGERAKTELRIPFAAPAIVMKAPN
ncbi:MAG: DUF2283 domain-containing protein [Candidatus Aenigmarchaeota archaeon]|nr:DUF2283 domain-containing protein [Candidatus Aenigmarchaeota archaeon]